MRCYGLAALLLITLAAGAVPAPLQNSLPALQPASSGASRLEPIRIPTHDDADDSVVYSEGFENGWEDWSGSDLTNVSNRWHISNAHGYDDSNSWWCSDEEIGGYDDHWLQYLITPSFNLSAHNNVHLNFKLFWSCENPEVGGAPQDPYDAWDGCNVWVSTDGGESWDVISPTTPEYNYTSLYSFGEEWGMGANIPGWCASSGEWPAGAWVDASVNLSAFHGEQDVRVRWAFASDPGWHTGGNGDPNMEAIGMQVDEMQVVADGDTIWSNNGDEQGDLTAANDQGEPSGDYWEITDTGAHDGSHSAHCAVQPNLHDALVSPELEIPSDQFYTYFDFWVRCDTRRAAGDHTDNNLRDLFDVSILPEGGTWMRMIYDYADDAYNNVPEHHVEWWDDFGYFGPDTCWQRPGNPVGYVIEPWQWKLNLSQFAGQKIRLRWDLVTDADMQDPQGSGLYIDDIHLNVSARAANDVGVDWVSVGYPATRGAQTYCALSVTNFGMSDQDVVRKYYQIDSNNPGAIATPSGILSDSSDSYTFRPFITAPYADTVSLACYTSLDGDQRNANDRIVTSNIVIYPPGIIVLGYDQHDYRYRFNYDQHQGAAIRFTPRDDDNSLRTNYDIKAIRVRWNGGDQPGDADVKLHIFKDNAGAPGDELYSETVTVTRADLLPNIQVIDLTDVEAVQNLANNSKFWVWFELLGNDHYPQIIGDTPEVSLVAGHNFLYNDTTATPLDGTQWQIHAVIMATGKSGTDLLAGRPDIDFGAVRPDFERTMRLAVFNGGTTPVTVEDVQSTDGAFIPEAQFDFPYTLGIGDMALILVTFAPTADQEYSGEIDFTSDDQTPPVVHLAGVGDHNSGVAKGDKALPIAFHLGAAYPNPFNAVTAIPYSLPRGSDVKLTVFDIAGRQVAQVYSGRQAAGEYNATFDGSALATGVYIYKLEAGSFVAASKMALIK